MILKAAYLDLLPNQQVMFLHKYGLPFLIAHAQPEQFKVSV